MSDIMHEFINTQNFGWVNRNYGFFGAIYKDR